MNPIFTPTMLMCLFATTLSTVLGSVTMGQENEKKKVQKQSVVIVHGAWGGAHHWKQVGDALMQDSNLIVRRASLTGQGERVHLASPKVNLETHISDVVNLIKFDDLKNVVLIGHSYGGCVISGVADQVPERIAKLIYLDAHLLDDGECFFSGHDDLRQQYTKLANELGDGWKIPVTWDKTIGDVAHPLATLTQPIKLKNPSREKIDSSYWLFLDGGDLEQDSRANHYHRAVQRGWSVKSFSWGHNPQRSNAVELIQALKEKIARK